MLMTSAYANKVLKKLQDDKTFWTNREDANCFYVAALDEEPVIPEYDYEQVAAAIADIDSKIIKIKHAINLANATNVIEVAGEELHIDEVLVKLAQLNNRKRTLDFMRKQESKMRINNGSYSLKKTAPEYRYANYDLDAVKAEYERVDALITAMQIALDRYNQTVEFEVEY